MRSGKFGAAAGLVAVLWATAANAQTGDATARADAAFKEAMALHTAGRDVDACPKFAESKQLAPAIGVTLYLADCYERTGRKASAWREFRDAESARAHGDKRADVAAQRAAALEPQLNRLTVDVPSSAAKSGAEVQLDGAALPQSFWGAPLAVDPGDHVVTIASPGQALQASAVHVDVSSLSTVAHVGGEEAASSAPAPPLAGRALAEGGASGAAAVSGDAGSATGRWAGVGLMVAGAVGVGVGTWLVTSKTRDMMANGQLCDPHLRAGAVPGAIIAYSAGGVALISGIVLYYVNRPGHSEVSLTPAYVPGGGGAVLRATF